MLHYREHKGSRGSGYCVDRGRSMPCDVPDNQIGRIVQAIVLPEVWMDRVLARIHLADDVERVQHERVQTEQRLRPLGTAYVDGLYSHEDYHSEKRALDDKLATLVVPGVDAAMEAGKLMKNLPVLWEEADLTERRKLLMAMLDAVYVDTVEERSVVAIRPKPAFRPIFEIATPRGGSGIVLINERPPDPEGPEAESLCSWWRRGRDELHQPVNLMAALQGWKALPAEWLA